jgi:hypothetical protein
MREKTVRSSGETRRHHDNPRNCRAFWKPPSSRQSGATGWWWTQSPRASLRQLNSRLTGKITGNIRFFGHTPDFDSVNRPQDQCVAAKFPRQKTGNYSDRTGKLA